MIYIIPTFKYKIQKLSASNCVYMVKILNIIFNFAI